MSMRSIDTYTMEELSTIYDFEIEEMLKKYWKTNELYFEGDYLPSTTPNNKFSGLMKNVTLPKSKTILRYPIINKPLVFKIKSNFEKGRYSFKATLAPREFRNQISQLMLLNVITKTIKPSHNVFATQDKIAQIYRSIREDWKTDEQIAVGVYTYDKKDKCYYLEDIRSKSFTSLSYLDNGEIRIKLDEPISGIKIDQFYEFGWKISLDNSERGYHLVVDPRQKFKSINPYGLIKKLYDSWDKSDESIADQMKSTMRMISTQLTSSSDGTFLYELLQNANDYPQQKEGTDLPVEVEFHLTNNYLIYRHSGEYFSPRNVAAICKVAAGEKTKKKNAIGYKGIGFKTVFNDHDYVYIKTGPYSFRYDLSQRKSRFNPWQIMPIWTNDNYVTPEISQIFEKDSDVYRVQMAMRPIDPSLLRFSPKKNYEYLLKDIFKDVRDIIFIPNVEAVRVYIDGKLEVDCDKRKENGEWVVTKTPLNYVFKQNEIDALINEANNNKRIPEKYKEFTDTNVSFACRLNGNKLEGIKEARVYCYLPTQISFGFSFLMNTDMIPSGARDDIEEGVDFNKNFAEIAGAKFFEWIQSLIQSGKYDYESIFALIPDFEECIKGRKAYIQDCIRRFQRGFENCINTHGLVPVLGSDSSIEYLCIKNIINDLTSITGKDVFEDEKFLAFSELNGKLAHPSLRFGPNFKRALSLYGEKTLRFDKNSLWTLFKNNDFVTWLKNKENNVRWTNFVVDKYPEDYGSLPMFISEHDTTKLYLAADLYYNIDDVLPYLSAFANLLPRLSVEIREKCKALGNEKNLCKFKKREISGLVDGILFNKDNIVNTQKSLETKINSVNFIKFLAIKKVSSAHLFNKIPLTDIDGKLIPVESTSAILRKLFFNSELVTKMRNEKWFSKKWITVLDDEYYSDESIKEYLKGYNISELDDHYVINNLLVDGKCCEDVSANIGDSNDISKKFVEYLFTHQDSIDGIEVKTSETEKATKYDRFTGYSIFFVNGKGEEEFLPVSKDNVFNEITDTYLHYGWFDNSWVYQVALSYYDGKDDNEKKSISAFFKKYFGLVDLNDSKFKGIIKDHFEEIKPKITADCELNQSFWTFLGKYQWNENSKDLNVFRTTPLLLDEEELPTEITGKKNLYYYHEELHDIAKSSWMPADLITILSKKYDDIPGIKDLLNIIGFKAYDVQQFSPFFDGVILNQEVPTSIPEKITQTVYSVSLDTKEKCVDFHNFMSKKYNLLNNFEKSLLKGTPVYVYGKEGLRRFGFGYCALILGEDKYGILEKCTAGLLPEINALDSSFVTEANLSYWKNVIGCIEVDDEILCLWIEHNSATISQTLQNESQNIVFWKWLFDSGISSQAKIGRLKSLPLIIFTARDADNKEDNQKIASLSTIEIYMSNSYMGQAQIEDFARKHGKSNFISSLYVREADDIDEWRRFFRNLGVKDNVKDVIYSIIMNDLPTLKDKNFPWVLVDQYSTELADQVKWAELAPKLKELQVETTTEGVFVPIANALRITVDNYSQKEPFKMVKLTGEISRDYYQVENVKNLINKIAEEAKTHKIAELQQWQTAKVGQFLVMQDSLSYDEFKDMHFSFIKELFGHTENLERNKIKLYDREWKLIKSEELYLGSKYECKCDFERFGISKTFVNDEYLKLGKVNECSRVLRSIGCQDRFKENDIGYLTDKNFSIYFWCKYVGSKDITIIGSVNSWVKEGKFNDIACIPPENGEMKKACELYSSSLADYMKYIPNFKEKIIDQKMQFTDPLIELCKQCLDRLSISDIINFLINSKPKNVNRISALQWLLDDNSEEKETWLTTYIKHDNALWLNGQGEPSHVSSLLAIDPNKCNQAYVFKSSPRVIDISYFPQGKELDVCKMFKIPVFSDDDLVPKPVTTPDSGQTLTVSREIIRRLLLVIAYRYRFDWSDMFNQMKQKMQDVKFMLCESISYGYNDLSIDNEDFYFDPNNKIFYYVDSWQDKKVYESFIGKLCDYLAMDLDYRECKGKLDENFNGKKVANYLNQNCRDLYNDEEFISVIKQYWNDIVPLLDIKVVEEPEIDDDEVVEEIKQEKYYEEELNVDRQEEQEEVSEQQEEQSSEDTQTDSSQKNSQSADSSNTSSSHGASSTSHSEQTTESTSENEESQKTAEEQKTATDNKAIERKESTDNKQSESKKSESKNSGSNSSRQSSSSSQRQRTSKYEPKTPTEEEIRRFKYQSSTKTFTTEDMQDNEYEALNKILGEGLSPEEIVTENYLAQLRFWNSLKENDMAPADVTLEDFVRDNKDGDYELTNGKYVHRCSARGGILHISPSIWNMVTDDRCIICVFVGAKVNEFFYIHNKKELLDWIAEDAIVIKLTGSEKVEAVNKLYSEILMDKGTAYTLIRVAYNESYNSLFSDMESNDFNQTNFNDDDYGD